MTQEDEAEELNALKDEQDMPIEELLKMYGYNKDAAKDPAEAGPSEAGAAEEAEVDAEDDEEEEEDGDDEEKAEVEKVADEEKEEKGEELVTQVCFYFTSSICVCDFWPHQFTNVWIKSVCDLDQK